MKRHVAVILLASMLLPLLAACGEPLDSEPLETQPAETQPAESQSAETAPLETELTDNLPEKSFSGADYKILTAAEQWQRFYVREELIGEVMNDAVFERNLTVEDRFDVKLQYRLFNGYTAGMADVKNALSGSVMSGGGDYDLFVGSSSYVIGQIGDKMFSNLDEADYLDLKAPWWFQYVNDELRINNKQYLGAGSLNMLNYAWAIVMYFNQNIARDFQLGDLYSIVNEGKWTWDTFTQMADAVVTDVDGNGKYDANDIVGVYSTADYFAFLMNSFDYEDSTHNDDGTITINPITDKLASINERLYYVMNSKMYMNRESGDYAPMQSDYAAGHALFMYHRLEFTDTDYLRNMDGYGILPSPKYDEQQENYKTAVVSEVSVIPAVVMDMEMSAMILEALQYETWKTVRPAYYDIALKTKYSQDEASGQMLDIIFDNLTASFSYMYSRIIGGYPGNSLGQSEAYASNFARFLKVWQKKLDALMVTLQEE